MSHTGHIEGFNFSNEGTTMGKKRKSLPAGVGSMAEALDSMASLYALSVLGSVGMDDATRAGALLSVSAQGKAGYVEDNGHTFGSMLLILVHMASQRGMTFADVVDDAALLASEHAGAAQAEAAVVGRLDAEASSGVGG